MKSGQKLHRVSCLGEGCKKTMSERHALYRWVALSYREQKFMCPDAKNLAALVEERFGATKTRVQEVDMEGEFEWLKEIGLK